MIARRLLVAAMMISALAAACGAGSRAGYTPEEARALDDLGELMHVNEDVMKPIFALADAPEHDGADFVRMSEAAAVIEASAESLRDRHALTYSDVFARYAAMMGKAGKELAVASDARSSSGSSAAIRSIQEACRSCHAEFRKN